MNIVISVNISTPIEQNITYESDVLLAAFVAPMEDITDVTHAPICIPYTIYTAFGNANAPAAPNACNTPTVADELCTTPANIVPNIIPTIGLLTDVIMFLKNSISANGFKLSLIVVMPKNNMPKPAIICPAYLVLFFLLKLTMNAPTHINIGIYCAILNDNIRLVTVVPIVAPMITPIPCVSVIKPALTKPTTMTDTAVELCMIAVTIIPTNAPRNLFEVSFSRITLNFAPAASSKPSPSNFIP